ncbi:hypothetical protein [Arthrobacter sp. A5]
MIEPADDLHRTCAECDADCAPEPFEVDRGRAPYTDTFTSW